MKVRATEMHDAEVDFISLVPAGANRAPIRVIKSEEGGPMIAVKGELFSDVFKTEEGAEPQPAVIAVVAAKGANLDAAKALIEKADAGLTVDNVQTLEDGSTAFIQKAAGEASDGAPTVTYKLADDLAALIQVSKAFDPFPGSTSFTENLNSLGFFPGFDLAQGVLRGTVGEVMLKAESAGDAASGIKAATGEFASHVSAMAATLPAEVFKLEEVIRKQKQTSVTVTVEQLMAGAKAAARQPGEGTSGLLPDSTQAENGEEIANRPVANKDEGGRRLVIRRAEAEMDEDGKDKKVPAFLKGKDRRGKKNRRKDDVGGVHDLTAGEQEAADKDAAGKAQGLKGGSAKTTTAKDDGLVLKAIEALGGQLTDLGKRVDGAVAKADEATRVAKAADEALNGTVHVTTGANEDGERAVVSDDIPLIDTAFEDKAAWGEA